jgi:hypothetical protein
VAAWGRNTYGQATVPTGLSNVVVIASGTYDSLALQASGAFPWPAISMQPSNQVVRLGGTAAFTVTASGTVPLKYQWCKSGVEIDGATGAALVLSNVTTNDRGSYSVVVTNSLGCATSAVAALDVVVPPAITSGPEILTVVSGSDASFWVGATGEGALQYRWRHGEIFLSDDSRITGSDATNLLLQGALLADAGFYSVVVSNTGGSVTSTPAWLEVIASQFLAAEYKVGGVLELTVQAERNRAFEIQGSTNLLDWVSLQTVTNETGTFLFTEPGALEFQQRFYRAVLR